MHAVRRILLALILLAGMSGPARASEKIFYYHNDHLGTPQAMTNSSGVVVWQADYRPFGEAAVNEDPDGNGVPTRNNLRFPGQYYDAETGLHYNWHRYYEAQTGRYLQPDPIGLRGGPNPYIYAYDNPINYIDPDGRFVWILPAGAAADAALGAAGATLGGMSGAAMGDWIDELIEKEKRKRDKCEPKVSQPSKPPVPDEPEPQPCLAVCLWATKCHWSLRPAAYAACAACLTFFGPLTGNGL